MTVPPVRYSNESDSTAYIRRIKFFKKSRCSRRRYDYKKLIVLILTLLQKHLLKLWTTADTVVTMHTVDADEQAESLATNQEIIFIVAIGPLDDQSFILEIDDVITTVSLYGGGDFRISDFILGDGANAQKEVRCYKEGSVSN